MPQVRRAFAGDAAGTNVLIAAPGAARRLEIRRVQVFGAVAAGTYHLTDSAGGLLLGTATAVLDTSPGHGNMIEFDPDRLILATNVGFDLEVVSAATTDYVVIVDYDDRRVPDA